MKRYVCYADGFDTNQQAYERQVGLVGMISKLIANSFVYSPFIYTGYLITANVFHYKDIKHLSELAIIAAVAVALYAIVQVLIVWMQRLRINGNGLWVLLFVLCVAFTSGLASLIMYGPASMLIDAVHKGGNEVAAWVLAILFGLYVFKRYRFFEYTR